MKVIGVPWHFEPDENGGWRKVYDKKQICENLPKQMGAETISIGSDCRDDILDDCNNCDALLEVR